MFKKFAEKGKDRSYVYAWVVRDIMSRYSGMPIDDKADMSSKENYRIKFKLRKSREKLEKKRAEKKAKLFEKKEN